MPRATPFRLGPRQPHPAPSGLLKFPSEQLWGRPPASQPRQRLGPKEQSAGPGGARSTGCALAPAVPMGVSRRGTYGHLHGGTGHPGPLLGRCCSRREREPGSEARRPNTARTSQAGAWAGGGQGPKPGTDVRCQGGQGGAGPACPGPPPPPVQGQPFAAGRLVWEFRLQASLAR